MFLCVPFRVKWKHKQESDLLCDKWMCLKTWDSENSQNKWSRPVKHMKENGREFLHNANLDRASVPIATEANGGNEDIMLLFMLGMR